MTLRISEGIRSSEGPRERKFGQVGGVSWAQETLPVTEGRSKHGLVNSMYGKGAAVFFLGFDSVLAVTCGQLYMEGKCQWVPHGDR